MSVFSNPLRISASKKSKDRVARVLRPNDTLADLVRAPQLHSISLSSIDVSKDKREGDDHFLKLYVRYLEGKSLGLWSRVENDRIIPGFYKRSAAGATEYMRQEVNFKDIAGIVRDIRRGFRPALVLYRGIFGDSEGKLVCSDDVHAYYGYREADIHLVPAMILGPRELLTESAICTRMKDREARFDSTTPIPPKTYQTILGADDVVQTLGFVEALRKLKGAADLAARKVSEFHIPNQEYDADVVHYHQTLHSVAYRMAEGLAAIELLFERGLAHQLRPLVRSLYELFLNFYIDWLCPEQIGPLLQSLAILKQLAPDSAEAQKLRRAIESTYKGLADICSNASAKANLSPLGKIFHESAYPILSQIVHQDFNVLQEYVMTLEAGTPKKLDMSELRTVIRWLDLIVTAASSRILDDVGASRG
jgi:Family of unknown function (DUF5677)